VVEFARAAFHTDDEKKSRLTANEFERLRTTLNLARERDGWAWYPYGRAVHDVYRRYEDKLLPEPAAGEPVTSYAQLGTAEKWFEKGRGRNLTYPHAGRWPDFALAVHNYATIEKTDRIPLPPLGPARPSEFKEPLRGFVTKELVPALPADERKALDGLRGKWPEYPREVVRLSKQHDLSAPGLMPPGSPTRWEAMYSLPPRPRQ
jgi:hypothetical protein